MMLDSKLHTAIVELIKSLTDLIKVGIEQARKDK